MSRKPDNKFAGAVLAWFDLAGRNNLPWQRNITPYRVWVSEIMLQQTQVSTVIPYYQRFMTRFPDVQTLAEAELDHLLNSWTGLGYYARARNLHKTAQRVVSEHGGEFPDTVEELEKLPGIGRSTAGAISAIAFQRRAAILDGNVKRVLTRFHAIEGWPGKSSVNKILWKKSEQHTPTQRVANYTQAIMDLGATVCTRSNPACDICPLQEDCAARTDSSQHLFPTKKPTKKLPTKKTLFLILRNTSGEVLLEQRPAQGLWGGLWTFPECNTEDEIQGTCQRYNCEIQGFEYLPPKRHTFSHFHLEFCPTIIHVKQAPTIGDTTAVMWHNPANPLSTGTAAPVQQLLETLG